MKYLVTTLTAFVLMLGLSAFADEHMNMSGEHMMNSDSMAMPMDGYPVDFCVVSGEKLGEMGDPVKYDYKGRTIEFCCSNCVSKFEADPDKYVEKLDNAIAESQGKDYPLSTCVVSGEKLGEMGNSVDIIYNNELVRLCCSNCKKSFNKDPEEYMKMVHDARKAHGMKEGADSQ